MTADQREILKKKIFNSVLDHDDGCKFTNIMVDVFGPFRELNLLDEYSPKTVESFIREMDELKILEYSPSKRRLFIFRS
jgi:hypothetical protein